MFVDYQYELGFIEIGVRFHRVDGADVIVNEYTDNGWDTVYEMRVIADNLWEYLYTGLTGAGLSDEDAVEFIETVGVEYPEDAE